MSQSHQATGRPYTLALCAACQSPLAPAVLDQLRVTVRRSDYGMLVTTGCLLGELTCAARGNGAGSVLMLQPCSIDRVAHGPARWVGPIGDADDLRTVRTWVEQGRWMSHLLPERLRLELRLSRRATRVN